MKNLQNFNVSELSNEELKSNSGGFSWLGPWKIYSSLGNYFGNDNRTPLIYT